MKYSDIPLSGLFVKIIIVTEDSNRKELLMRTYDRIEQALENVNLEKDTVDRLIYLAWMMGREEATKEVSDKYKEILKGQHERAGECRYHNMAEDIVGFPGDYIYFADYSQDVTTELSTYYDTDL